MKHIFKCVLCAALALLTAAGCVSCTKVSATELTEGFARKETGREVPDEAFAEKISSLSLSVLQKVTKGGGGNDLLSPLTLFQCLSMLAEGAAGDTREELAALLGAEPDALHGMLFTFRDGLPAGITTANSLWLRDTPSLKVQDGYLQTLADWYGAPAYRAPFDASTVQDINRWCDQQTKGMIPKMLDGIDGDDQLFLLSSLLFDLKWEEKYEKKDVKDGVFHPYGGGEQDVKMLCSSENTYLFSEEYGLRGFAKPYKEGKYAFVGLVPQEGDDLYGILSRLTPAQLRAIWNERKSGGVSVQMPEFAFDSDLTLIDAIAALGAPSLFDPAKCDLSGMASSDEGNLYVGLLRQKNRIEVDRNGTKAASVTIAGVNRECSIGEDFSDPIVLDRPFLFLIVDTWNGIPLFIGTVSSVTQ